MDAETLLLSHGGRGPEVARVVQAWDDCVEIEYWTPGRPGRWRGMLSVTYMRWPGCGWRLPRRGTAGPRKKVKRGR